MAHKYGSPQNEPEGKSPGSPWSKLETDVLTLGLQGKYSYTDIKKQFLPWRSVRACEGRVETLEKNGELPDFLLKIPRPPKRRETSKSGPSTKSQRRRTRSNQGRKVSSPPPQNTSSPRLTRRRRIVPQQPISAGNHGDSSDAQGNEARNIICLSPDSSPTEDSSDSCIGIGHHTDRADFTPPVAHDGTKSAGSANLARLPAETADRSRSDADLSLPQINVSANDDHKIHEAVSSEVEIEQIYNSIRKIIGKLSGFNAESSRLDVNDRHKVNEWFTNFKNLEWLLRKWTSDLPPRYEIVNAEIPTDAPLQFILAHLFHRVAQIQLYIPVAYYDRLQGSKEIQKLSDVSANECVSAATDIISIIEKYLEKLSVKITLHLFTTLFKAFSYACRALRDHSLRYPGQDTVMSQRIFQINTDLTGRVDVDAFENFATSKSRNDDYQQTVMLQQMSQGNNSWMPTNMPNLPRQTTGEDSQTSNQQNNFTLFNSPSIRMENDPPREHEVNFHTPSFAGGRSTLSDGPHYQRQQQEVESNTMAYAVPLESSETSFSQFLDDPIFQTHSDLFPIGNGSTI